MRFLVLQLNKMENAEDVRAAVELYIYDLSKGMAATMSELVIGKSIYLCMSMNYLCSRVKVN